MKFEETHQVFSINSEFAAAVFRCRTSAVFLCLILLCSCGQNGPASTQTSSMEFSTLDEKIKFLQKYRSFQRNFLQLEFDINYKNNNSWMLPAPSDWDIRLVAEVPADEIDLWIVDDMRTAEPGVWVKSVTTDIDITGIEKWYRKGGTVVGIDRANSVVAYRHNTFGD